MNIGKLVLGYYSSLFMAFGIAGLVAPNLVTDLISYSLNGPVAQTEFMATYGGLFIGLGAYMLYCTGNNVHTGLVCVLITMGTMLITRSIGYVSFGGSDLVQHIYLAGELFTVLLVTAILRKSTYVQQSA